MTESLPLGTGVDEFEKRKDDLLAIFGESGPEVRGDDYFPLWLSNADRYYRSTLDLHIHGIWGDWEFCVVMHHLVGVGVRRSPIETIRPNIVGDGDLFESKGVEGQILVTVGIGEAIENTEVMHIEVGVPSTIARLQRLEDCYSAVIHESDVGIPSSSSVESLLILPWLGVAPNPLPEDWESDMTPLRFRDETASQMFESGANVVKKVGGDQKDARVNWTREVETVHLTLALHPVAHRVWVAVAKSGDFLFEIDKVFFSPFQLEQARGND